MLAWYLVYGILLGRSKMTGPIYLASAHVMLVVQYFEYYPGGNNAWAIAQHWCEDLMQ